MILRQLPRFIFGLEIREMVSVVVTKWTYEKISTKLKILAGSYIM